jgi:hypothetical protein
LKEAASGKAVAGDRLCLGVAYTVEVSWCGVGAATALAADVMLLTASLQAALKHPFEVLWQRQINICIE